MTGPANRTTERSPRRASAARPAPGMPVMSTVDPAGARRCYRQQSRSGALEQVLG